MFNLSTFPPVHCSKKEVRRLRGVGYSYREIGVTLGVSTAHAHRINNGYRCRCGSCPRARSLKKLVALKPPARTRRPSPGRGRDDGENGNWLQQGLNTAGQLAAIWNAFKESRAQDTEDNPPKSGW